MISKVIAASGFNHSAAVAHSAGGKFFGRVDRSDAIKDAALTTGYWMSLQEPDYGQLSYPTGITLASGVGTTLFDNTQTGGTLSYLRIAFPFVAGTDKIYLNINQPRASYANGVLVTGGIYEYVDQNIYSVHAIVSGGANYIIPSLQGIYKFNPDTI